MRKKASFPFLYFILFSVPAVVLVLFITLEIRDRKIEKAGLRIRNLEELVTARQIYRNVIYSEVKENLIVDKRSLFTINYIVTAGVDLSGGLSLKAESGQVVVSYPSPGILSIDADESSIDEYFALERFGKIRQSDYLDIVFDEKERIRKEALDSELLQRADKNLQRLIRGILEEQGISEIRFDRSDRGVSDET
jgi:hypothetical protein